MRFTVTLATVAGLAILVSGCSGGDSTAEQDDQVPTMATVRGLVECMEGALPSYRVSTDQDGPDLVAGADAVGAFQVTRGPQEIQVVVERSEGDAENTAANYEAFGRGRVDQAGPVVAAYNKKPTPEVSEAVEGCVNEDPAIE